MGALLWVILSNMTSSVLMLRADKNEPANDIKNSGILADEAID